MRLRGISGGMAAPADGVKAAAATSQCDSVLTFVRILGCVLGYPRHRCGANCFKIWTSLRWNRPWELPQQGVTITGDAIFTQRAICQVIIDGGGDCFFTVKSLPRRRPGPISLA
jgi:hypothetical protein